MEGDLMSDRTLDFATEKNQKRKTGAGKEVCEASEVMSDRPIRQRKCVERLVLRVETDRQIRIEKGPGTKLKDIPNVAYKLSRKKNENALKLLHSILFSRRGKAAETKNNLLRFSGLVWQENEDKEKKKVRDKLEKCVKARLVELSTILDLTVSSKKTRKNDIIVKLMEFLEAPHATTSELISEKEQSSQGKKRSMSSVSGATPSEQSFKKIKMIVIPSRKGLTQKMAAATQNESREVEEKDAAGCSIIKASLKNNKEVEKQQPLAIKVYSRRRKSDVLEGTINHATETPYPSDRDIQKLIYRIIQENTVDQITVGDIIRQIGKTFNMDPTPRKPSIRLMIKDQLSKLTL